MSVLTVAATQMACSWDKGANIANADRLVRRAAAQGAKLILLQELFETPYFCQDVDYKHMDLAGPVTENAAVRHFQSVARELGVVLPISVYERDNNALYNSLAMIDADGAMLGIYRKSHIPDGPGYHEKFYFNPGDTGFPVWETAAGKIGAAICWDQWFPEAARILALKGADVICYPTAIGSEPHDPSIQSKDHWQRTMQGHAAANLTPVVCSNRIGREVGASAEINFYGSSFIAGIDGAMVEEANQSDEAILVHSFDLDANRRTRLNWGVFRDRRPDLYSELLTLDGHRTYASKG